MVQFRMATMASIVPVNQISIHALIAKKRFYEPQCPGNGMTDEMTTVV